MKDEGKVRKPGRSVFFGDRDDEEGQRSISPSGDGKEEALSAESKAWLMNLLEALTATQKGDFSMRLPMATNGLFGEIALVFNDVVELNESMADEIVRVSQIVAGEGNLTERASLGAVRGLWSRSVDSINTLINSLAQPTIEIGRVISAVARGDMTQKMTLEVGGVAVKGEFLKIATTTNTMVDQLNAFASEVTRVAREVGMEGRLGGKAEVEGVSGTWKDLTDNVNMLASNLTNQVRNIAEVTTAVAEGDLSRKITVEAQGEVLELKGTINKMVDQLNAFASEVTRVAGEVGTEGRLGGQAKVEGVSGTWRDLTENVNMLASNLTDQVRNIADVTTAVAEGDLSRKITVDARGEILELKNTINTMVDQLNAFASEVTRVAGEVGTNGMLGGQAEVEGVSGTWRDLTENVNMLASNLTDQVRNIAEVTTAVANGDLSRKITVEAQGEILELKDTINGMVDNLNAVIGDINNVMALVSNGSLTETVTAEAAGDFASMITGINATIVSLREIVVELTEAGTNVGAVSQNILSAGQEMSAVATQLSSSVEQIAAGAQAQAQQIMDASKESEGVSQTASETLIRAENTNEMAEVANKASSDGSKAMEETTANMELMLEGSANSVTSIESLSASTEQIQEIVEVIRDIATQTNILAINAAIEAVRAGKQGRGFAVVAEEVKTLSADSKEQARKISNLVQSVLKETDQTAITIRTMAENVELGRRSVEQTSETFVKINDSIENTSHTAGEIAEAAAEQKKSIDLIAQSLDSISGIATDTSTGSIQATGSTKGLLANVQELTATAATLGDMSEKLLQTVGRFTVE